MIVITLRDILGIIFIAITFIVISGYGLYLFISKKIKENKCKKKGENNAIINKNR